MVDAQHLIQLHFVRIDDPASPKFTDWILVGMSLMHLTLSGLAVALVLFHSEREVDAGTLAAKAEDVLASAVPQTLARASADYSLRTHPSRVERLGSSDIFGAAYRVVSGSHALKVWVGLNVSRLFAIVWIVVPDDEADLDVFVVRLRHIGSGHDDRVVLAYVAAQ